MQLDNDDIDNITLEQILKLLEDKKMNEIEEKWRFLSGNIRICVMQETFLKKDYNFVNEKHFEKWTMDWELIKGKILELAKQFNLTEGYLKNFILPSIYIYDSEDLCVLWFALYLRLMEYSEISKKYLNDTYTSNLIKNNPEILKCNAKRTEIRLKFLNDIGKFNPKEAYKDLILRTEIFNIKYQKEIERKINNLSKNEKYCEILKLIKKIPDFVYDDFLEFLLSYIYEDNISKEIYKVHEEYFLKYKTKDNIWSQEKINKFLKELEKEKIICRGIYKKKSRQNNLINYYLFSSGNIDVLEPIGYPGEEKFIIVSDFSNDVFLDDDIYNLIQKGKIIRLNHIYNSDKYIYSIEYFKNCLKLLTEGSKKDKKLGLQLIRIQNKITGAIPISNIYKVTDYIMHMKKIIKKIYKYNINMLEEKDKKALADVFRIYEILREEEKDMISKKFLRILLYFSDLNLAKPLNTVMDLENIEISEYGKYLILYMCTLENRKIFK